MRLDGLRIFAGALCAAMLIWGSGPALAQGSEAKGGNQRAQAAEGENQKKIDVYAEAAARLSGPAGNPECVWLGRRAVGLLARDDLDTAFRHLDLYDRFGCPSAHIQAAFRCLVRQEGDDPKGEKMNDRTLNCWINPSTEPVATPSAAAPTGTTKQ